VCIPLNVLMVHSEMLAVATDGERLTCGDFSLGKIIRFGSLEFITDCFGSQSLSSKGSDSGAIFIGTTNIGLPALHTIFEDSTDEFYTTSGGEGSFGLPISRRHSMETPLTPITTTPWLEDTPTP
jgi:hypothetical protein